MFFSFYSLFFSFCAQLSACGGGFCSAFNPAGDSCSGGGGGTFTTPGTASSGSDHEWNGYSANASSTVRNELGNISEYIGVSGHSGNAYVAPNGIGEGWLTGDGSGSRASAGTSAPMYVNAAFLNVANTEAEAIHMKRLAEAMVTQGGVQTTPGTENAAAQITYICAPETTELLNAFPGVQSTGSFTRYFDVVENANGYTVDMVINGRGYDQRVVEENGDVITVTYYKAEELVASFSYELVHNDDGTTSYEILSTVYHPDFKIVTMRGVGYKVVKL